MNPRGGQPRGGAVTNCAAVQLVTPKQSKVHPNNRKYEKVFWTSGPFKTKSCSYENKCKNKNKVCNRSFTKSCEIKSCYTKPMKQTNKLYEYIRKTQKSKVEIDLICLYCIFPSSLKFKFPAVQWTKQLILRVLALKFIFNHSSSSRDSSFKFPRPQIDLIRLAPFSLIRTCVSVLDPVWKLRPLLQLTFAIKARWGSHFRRESKG